MFKGKSILVSILVLWWCLPLLLLLFLSVSINYTFPNLLPQHFTLQHWADFLFDNDGLQQSFFNSFSIALLVGSIATFLGFISSKWIANHQRKYLWLTLTYFPFALSPVIFAVCLKFYFLKAGLAGNIIGVIIAQLMIAFPYATIFFTSFWNNTIKNYQNIASTLGSNSVLIYRKIIFPLAKSLLLVCFFQCFLMSWFEYGLSSIIGYGKVPTLTIKVFQFIGEANIFYAALSSCLLIVPPIVLLWINKKLVVNQNR